MTHLERLLRDRYAAVPREPISTAIELTALIASATGASLATAGAIGGFIVTTAISLAISAAAAALQKSTKQSDLTTGYEGSGTLSPTVRRPGTSPIPPQRLVLGNVTSSGDVLWRRYDPPYFWIMYELAAHKSGALKAVRINGIDIPLETVSANGVVIALEDGATGLLRPNAAPFYNGSTRYIEVNYRDGSADQAIDAIVARDFPTVPATFRHRDHTTVMLKLNYGADQATHDAIYGTQNQFNPLFRFAGARYFDPRVPGCRMSDPETWIEGNSASLSIMRALYHQWPNTRLLDIGQINWDLMALAADIDDRWVGKADGTLEHNHTCDGIILSSADPLQMLKELLTCCDGFLVQRGGKYHILPGQKLDPEGTLHQGMLAGGFSVHTETPDRDLINIIKTEGVFPELDYKPSTGPVLRRDDLIALDGQELETTLTLPFTEGAPRLQRLGSRKLKESRGTASGVSGRKAFSGTFGIAAKNVKAGEVRRIYFKDFPKVNGDYMITRTVRDATHTKFTIDGVSWSNSRQDYHAPGDEQPFELDQGVLDAVAA